LISPLLYHYSKISRPPRTAAIWPHCGIVEEPFGGWSAKVTASRKRYMGEMGMEEKEEVTILIRDELHHRGCNEDFICSEFLH
jgi:hypothetical protein